MVLVKHLPRRIALILHKENEGCLTLWAWVHTEHVLCKSSIKRINARLSLWTSWHYLLPEWDPSCQRIPIRDLFYVLMPINALRLKKNMDFIGASRPCGKETVWQSAKNLLNENWKMWDREGLLNLRWYFKDCSTVAAFVESVLPLSTDWERGEMWNMGKLVAGENCSPCTYWYTLPPTDLK